VLVKKLLDDAALLLRRKRTTEALHRFNFALQKCSELLEEIAKETKENDDSGEESNEEDRSWKDRKGSSSSETESLSVIQPQLRQFKLQTLFSIAYLKRRNNELGDAIELASTAIPLASVEDEDTLFELYLFRAKCYFDARDVQKARADAMMAASLRAENADVQNLLAVLNT